MILISFLGFLLLWFDNQESSIEFHEITFKNGYSSFTWDSFLEFSKETCNWTCKFNPRLRLISRQPFQDLNS